MQRFKYSQVYTKVKNQEARDVYFKETQYRNMGKFNYKLPKKIMTAE